MAPVPARLVRLFAKNPGTGLPEELVSDGSGRLATASSGGGGGGGAVTQGAGAATSAAPWWVKVANGAGTLVDFATETTLSLLTAVVSEAVIPVMLDMEELESEILAATGGVASRFLAAVSMGSAIVDSITSTVVGAALLARDEDNSRFLRVSIDNTTRALNVRCFPRSVTTVRGSNNGTGTSAAYGKRLNVAGFGVQVVRAAVTNKSGSAAYLFIKDKGAVIANGDVSSMAPRLVPAGGFVDFNPNFPDSGFSNGLQLGLSTTADVYTEIAADDAFFECSRI